MAKNYKLKRRNFLKLVGEGIVVSQIPAPLFASDQWGKIKDAIPAGKYDVLLYTFPGGGKDQIFCMCLMLKMG